MLCDIVWIQNESVNVNTTIDDNAQTHTHTSWEVGKRNKEHKTNYVPITGVYWVFCLNTSISRLNSKWMIVYWTYKKRSKQSQRLPCDCECAVLFFLFRCSLWCFSFFVCRFVDNKFVQCENYLPNWIIMRDSSGAYLSISVQRNGCIRVCS